MSQQRKRESRFNVSKGGQRLSALGGYIFTLDI